MKEEHERVALLQTCSSEQLHFTKVLFIPSSFCSSAHARSITSRILLLGSSAANGARTEFDEAADEHCRASTRARWLYIILTVRYNEFTVKWKKKNQKRRIKREEEEEEEEEDCTWG